MTEKQDQQIYIKFCFQLGKTSSETIQMMQKAFGNECMSKTRIKEWYNRFKGGHTFVDSEFQDFFEKWKHRWNRIYQSSGDYFEGCNPHDDEE